MFFNEGKGKVPMKAKVPKAHESQNIAGPPVSPRRYCYPPLIQAEPAPCPAPHMRSTGSLHLGLPQWLFHQRAVGPPSNAVASNLPCPFLLSSHPLLQKVFYTH